MLEIIKKWWTNFNKSSELKYLEASTDHYDLEQRMKRIERRNAPFQSISRHHTTYIRGTIY